MLRTIPRQRSLIEPEIQNPFVHKLHLGFLDIVKVSVSTSVFTIVLNIRTKHEFGYFRFSCINSKTSHGNDTSFSTILSTNECITFPFCVIGGDYVNNNCTVEIDFDWILPITCMAFGRYRCGI